MQASISVRTGYDQASWGAVAASNPKEVGEAVVAKRPKVAREKVGPHHQGRAIRAVLPAPHPVRRVIILALAMPS
jgi:hypothetical protein